MKTVRKMIFIMFTIFCASCIFVPAQKVQAKIWTKAEVKSEIKKTQKQIDKYKKLQKEHGEKDYSKMIKKYTQKNIALRHALNQKIELDSKEAYVLYQRYRDLPFSVRDEDAAKYCRYELLSSSNPDHVSLFDSGVFGIDVGTATLTVRALPSGKISKIKVQCIEWCIEGTYTYVEGEKDAEGYDVYIEPQYNKYYGIPKLSVAEISDDGDGKYGKYVTVVYDHGLKLKIADNAPEWFSLEIKAKPQYTKEQQWYMVTVHRVKRNELE